mmetsp:Transcript_53448/g.128715  ORF Transcript_53448/g.128715 Transcript_53448/m.128715 type:complete len:345 (+) Transcript_53448:125-1159(+)
MPSTTGRPSHWRGRLGETPGGVHLLHLVEASQHTSASHTTQDVGTRTLEEGGEALVLQHLLRAVQGAVVLDGGTRRHHHPTADRVQRVGRKASGDGHDPAEGEGGDEAVGHGARQDHRLDRVVEAEVAATVHDDADARDDEATVQTLDAVGRERLAVHVNEAVELALAAALAGLGVVGQARTGVVERVHEGQRAGTGGATGSHVAEEPGGVAVLALAAEHGLELVLEGEVQGLGREVTDHVGGVATPQRADALVRGNAAEAVHHALVGLGQAALLDHLVLVLDQQLDALDGGSDRLGDGGRDTGEEEVLDAVQLDGLLLPGKGERGRAAEHRVGGHGENGHDDE